MLAGFADDLAILTAVIDDGSMSAAARRLGVTPALVSQRIAKLEDRLGVRLLNRTTRRLSLTEEGRALDMRAREILASLQDAEAAVSEGTTRPRGTLRVTLPAAFGRLHIAPLLPDFLARHPDMQVSATLTDAVTDLVDHGFDLAVRIGRLGDSSLIARRLAPNHRLLCASPAYLARHGAPARPEALSGHACLVLGSQPVWRFDGPDGEVTHRPRALIESNDGEVLRQAALAGAGLTLKSTWEVGPDLAAGTLVRVLADFPCPSDVAVHAVYPGRHHLSPRVRAFVDFLVDRFGPVPPWDRVLAQAEGGADRPGARS